MASSSLKNLLEEYHRLAADTLLGDRSTNIDEAVLSAAEDGQYNRIESLISRKRTAVDAKDPMTGDTPLIIAARNGHEKMVDLLLNHGADLTLQNDIGESALDLASPQLRKHILGSIQHEDRAMSNAQAFLQSAWLGDAVSVKKYLSGNHYLDVNVRNKDGLTPLLLVTRDIGLFDKVQNAMENDYNPVNVLQDLLDSHADISRCDRHGRNALHLVASSESIHARKMVSLLLKNGSSIDSVDDETYSPLHMASKQGHTAIIVALVEEGGADVNVRGGEQGDTPLMLTARGGHNEAARYLIARGADVTAVDENGDTALTVAKSPSMVRLLKEAWTEQTLAKVEADSETAPATTDHESTTEDELSKTPRSSISSDTDDLIARGALISPLSPERPEKNSFFLTNRKLSRSLADFDESELVDHETLRPMKMPAKSVPFLPLSEAEADDELDNDMGHRRTKPATRRAHIRANFEESLNKRKPGENHSPKHTAGMDSASKSRSLPRHIEIKDQVAYSSADEDYTRRGGGSKVGSRAARLRSRDEKKPHSGNRKAMEYPLNSSSGGPGAKSRPSRLALQHSVNDPSLSRSHDSLVGVTPTGSSSKREKKQQFLPDVVKSSAHTSSHRPRVSPKQKNASDKLPSLTDMQPVALVAVDTERDRLRVQQYNSTSEMSPRTKRISMQRSKSLMSVTSHAGKEGGVSPSAEGPPVNFNPKKRNSTGSLVMQRAESKVPLLPNVVIPQLGMMVQGVGHKPGSHTHQPVKGRGRLQPLVLSVTPTSPIAAKMLPTLSNINEDNESGSFDKTLTKSFHDLGSTSKDSTLKDSSHSDFETDSLERHGVIGGDLSVGTMIPSHTHSHSPLASGGGGSGGPGAIPIIGYVQMPHHQQQGGPHPLPVHSSNLVVNYAVQDGSIPLSPIWNQMQFLRTDSETSSNSEYITSYIGRLTPLPHVQAPDPGGSRKFGADSGHGESSDEEDQDGESSSGSGSEGEEFRREEEQDNCLKWKRGRLLGKGAYGKVWEGLMNSAKMIAVKEVELDSESAERAQSQYEKIQVEVEILRSLRHKNIVSYLGTSMQQSTVYIFMEYISGGSLQSILKRFGPLDCRTIAHYTRQITRALNYLHSNAIIHRDIKGANIMVTSRGVVKLIDFGCAKKYYQDLSAGFHSVRGTPYWMAPEVIRGDGYGRKSDIWSLGCTVHEMATTKPPWADYPPEAALFQIGSGKAIPELPDHLPHRLKNFVNKCLIKDQNQRPSANVLLEHEFLLVYKRENTN